MNKHNLTIKLSAITLRLGILLFVLLITSGSSFALYVPNTTEGTPQWLASSIDDPVPIDGASEDWLALFEIARDSGLINLWQGGEWFIDENPSIIAPHWIFSNAPDSDVDGIPDQIDPYPSDGRNQSPNHVRWWEGGGPWVINGVLFSFACQWYDAGAWNDQDSDGIPDELDDLPNDATNNSFELTNGITFRMPNAVLINGTYYDLQHTFRAGWYAGQNTDSNSNGLPEILEDWFSNPALHGTLQHWDGGVRLINGAWNSFTPISYFSTDNDDTDNDGIPNEIDPLPADPWNGSSYFWSGGNFVIDGQVTHFEAGTYEGIYGDQDSDNLPDNFDSHPEDSSNNSTWWQGGGYVIANNWQTFDGRWMSQTDRDTDSDGDGLPENVDPYPNDSTNGAISNDFTIYDPPPTYYFIGGEFRIDGFLQQVSPNTFGGYWVDSDGDNLPDPADPYPYSSSNNSSFWTGKMCYVNNVEQVFSDQWHRTDVGDQDADGLPDDIDPYLNDYYNNSGYYWGGGDYIIDGALSLLPEQTLTGRFIDSDEDGIPDPADQYPNDSQNNSYLIDSDYSVQNSNQHIGPTWFASWPPPPNRDGDELPDSIDPLPDDKWNGNTWQWPSVETDIIINNITMTFTPTHYYGSQQDDDGDGIPNVADPLPLDIYNGNDTDQDGIPDSLEVANGLDRNSASDAGYIRGDGLTNIQAYLYQSSWAAYNNQLPPLLSTQIDATRDTDNDGMMDVYEARSGLNPFNGNDAIACPNWDYVLNLEKAQKNINAFAPVNPDSYESVTGYTLGIAQQHHKAGLTPAEDDWDGDGVTNLDEITVFHTDIRNPQSRASIVEIRAALVASSVSLITLANYHYLVEDIVYDASASASTDSDGDGIPDIVEATITHTDPNKRDTDGDGIWDNEDANPRDPVIRNVVRVVIITPNEAEIIR